MYSIIITLIYVESGFSLKASLSIYEYTKTLCLLL